MWQKRDPIKKDIEYKLELIIISSLFDGEQRSLGPEMNYLKRNWTVIKEELDSQAHLKNCTAEEGWRVQQMMPLNAGTSDEVPCLIFYQREIESKQP